jgi:hypothetical protein
MVCVIVKRRAPRLAVVAAAGLAIAAVYRLRKPESVVQPVLIRVGFGSWGSGATLTGRAANRRRPRSPVWNARLDLLTDWEFKKRYKVARAVFADMVQRLRPTLEPDHEMARRSSGSPVTTELQLSMTLRFMAGASHNQPATRPRSLRSPCTCSPYLNVA